MTKQASSTAEFEREYSDHELICQEGESSNEMFIIQSGKVRIFKQARYGPVELALLEKGNFFGEMSVLEGLPRDATAEAVGNTRVLVMNSGALLVRMRRDPTLTFELLYRFSGRVRALNSRLLDALERSSIPGAAEAHMSSRAGTLMIITKEQSLDKNGEEK